MNKAQLVEAVAAATELKKSETSKVIESVFDAISAALQKGEEVRLVGFGTFRLSDSAKRTGARPDGEARARRVEADIVDRSVHPLVVAMKGVRNEAVSRSGQQPGASGQRQALGAALSPALRAALARASARGDEAVAEILARPGMLSSDEAARRFGVTRETINQWRRKGDLLGLEGAARGVRYPDWQIVDGRRLPGLRYLAGLLGPDPWAIYRFLVSRHDALDDECALEAIKQGREQEVFALAEGMANGAFV